MSKGPISKTGVEVPIVKVESIRTTPLIQLPFVGLATYGANRPEQLIMVAFLSVVVASDCNVKVNTDPSILLAGTTGQVDVKDV